MSDAALAKRIGVPALLVWRYRKRHGIKPLPAKARRAEGLLRAHLDDVESMFGDKREALLPKETK